MYKEFVATVRSIFDTDDFIPLHEPRLQGNEKQYLADTIDSTYVSSVGAFVDRFEAEFAAYTGAKHAVAVVNGTSALHIGLLLGGVNAGDEVITQPLSFVATCNAIAYCGAEPVFVDVEKAALGLCPTALAQWLDENTTLVDGKSINNQTGRRVAACVPMHTFGFIGQIERLSEICQHYGLALVEDAAESVGSLHAQQHSGTTGTVGAFSFNGNKIITSGGGGMLVTNDEELARKAKHLTTTAKAAHQWEFIHNELGYNYRMPNINAALGCAQLEQLDQFVGKKRSLHQTYATALGKLPMELVTEPADNRANYWLNTLVMRNAEERDSFLKFTNDAGVMTRPIWRLLNRLPMYSNAQCGPIENAQWLEERLVNIPSSVPV